MTQKQFKQALLRGQGRCIQAAQTDPEKYRSIVLWACSHEIAFDAQCEGTRAQFVYQLIGCYADTAPFLQAVIASLEKVKSDGGWKLLYLSELLGCFSGDGDISALQALWNKYDALYAVLLSKKRLPKGIFPERDDFAMLCKVLAYNDAAMMKIAEDIGALYRTKRIYDGNDFDWLFESKAKQYMNALKKQAKKSENIAQYLRAGQTEEDVQKQVFQKPIQLRSGIALSLWLKNKADPETVRSYANAYLNQSDPAARAKALEAFCRCPFPDDPAPIIADASANSEPLKEAAWQALEHIRHSSVRAFAIDQLHKGVKEALPILIANYQAQDETQLIELVNSIPVDHKDTSSGHSIQLDILGMKDHGLKAPAPLLRHIYESTYCSCCREYALRQMGKRRLLDKSSLEECLFDSNYDIRAYAQQCLNRRT